MDKPDTPHSIAMSTAQPTRVLIIGYVWPEPRSSAASGHMMQLIQCFLEQGWQITFASPATEGEHRADLDALGITQERIELNNSSFDVFVSQLAPDIVLFDQFMIEEQFGWRVEKQCPQALRILETSDLQSLRNTRHLQLKRFLGESAKPDDLNEYFQSSWQTIFPDMAASDLAQREVAALYRSDLSLMTSDVEMHLLTTRFGMPSALLHWCPLMIEGSTTAVPSFKERAHFLSIGNFRHAPNWDAVLWMKTAVWPLIRQQLPTAQLHIYGAYTPPKATALHNASQGFHIMNWAPDALQVMSQARVCLAPLRFGAGIKGKIVDAMRCGTPTITSPIGAEAMHGDMPWPGIVASSATEIAQGAVRLYQDQPLWQQAQQTGWALLEARYQHKQHCKSLIDRIATLRENLEAHRIANFTGLMLRHHHHKSTQYMAQWIEAKNRIV